MGYPRTFTPLWRHFFGWQKIYRCINNCRPKSPRLNRHQAPWRGPEVTIREPNPPRGPAFVDSGGADRKVRPMRLQRIPTGLAGTTAAAALALLLTACGPSQ